MTQYLNHYRCPCGTEWQDEWDCQCNDKCPMCNKEIEPHHSDILVLDDRYADSIIGDRAEDYDAIEIHGIRDINETGNPDVTCCEVDDKDPQFFSVHVHLKPKGENGGVECVGDHGTEDLAQEYAQELATKHGWPIHNFVERRGTSILHGK